MKGHWPNILLSFLEHPVANVQNIPNKSDGIIKTWQGGKKEPKRNESNFILTFNKLNIWI